VAALLVIANWPAPRIAHWFALLQARAIECQAYALGVNRTGEDPNGHAYPRSSCVFDPAGERLAPAWTEGELDGFTVDPARVQEQRTRLGFIRDRRPETYRRLLAPQP
jgi:predicted amidohydrolase